MSTEHQLLSPNIFDLTFDAGPDHADSICISEYKHALTGQTAWGVKIRVGSEWYPAGMNGGAALFFTEAKCKLFQRQLMSSPGGVFGRIRLMEAGPAEEVGNAN